MKKKASVMMTALLILIALAPARPSAAGKNSITGTRIRVPDRDASVVRVVCQMYEKQLLILEERKKLPRYLGDPTKQTKSEARSWLAKLDFCQIGSPARQDIEAYRNELVAYITKPHNGSMAAGERWYKVNKKLMAVLADYEINSSIARKHGYGQLSKSIDDVCKIGLMILLVKEDIPTKKSGSLRSVVVDYAQYFSIFNILAGCGVKSRNAIVQAALLSKHPETIANPTEREEFRRLHGYLLTLSRATIYKNEMEVLEAEIDSIMALCNVVDKFRITDAELRKAGGEKLVKQTRGMEKLRRGED